MEELEEYELYAQLQECDEFEREFAEELEMAADMEGYQSRSQFMYTHTH